MEGRLTVVVLLINVSVVQLISNNQELSQAKLRVQDGIRDTQLGKRNEELQESHDISGAVAITGTSSLKTYRNFYQSCSVENKKCSGQIENSSVRKHNEDNKHEDNSETTQLNLLRNGRQTNYGGQLQGAQDKKGDVQKEAKVLGGTGPPRGKHLNCTEADYVCFKNHTLPDENYKCQIPLSDCPDSQGTEWWVADEKLYNESSILRAVRVKKPCPPGKYMNEGKCVQALGMCKDMNTFFDIYGVVHCYSETKPPKNMGDYTKLRKSGNKCDVPMYEYPSKSNKIVPEN